MKPRLLDLFCGAGGAGMGYSRAGFEVVGVDIKSQPRYPFEFHQADALTFPLEGFDVIHASPPCQLYSATGRMTSRAHEHPDLVAPTRERLVTSGLPWVMENVIGAPFVWAVMLCGWSFGLPLHRHRLFELWQWSLGMHPGCPGPQPEGVSFNPYKTLNRRARGSLAGTSSPEYAAALGVEWMRGKEISQAIPPVYTEQIGHQLLDAVMARAA